MVFRCDAAAEKLVRQGVLAEEAGRDEREQVKLYWSSPGRHQHVSYVEHADHLRPELGRKQVETRHIILI